MALITGKINPLDVVKPIYEKPNIVIFPVHEEGPQDFMQQNNDYSIGEHSRAIASIPRAE